MEHRKGFLRRMGVLFFCVIILSVISFFGLFASSYMYNNFVKMSNVWRFLDKQFISLTSIVPERIDKCRECIETLKISENMSLFVDKRDALNTSMSVILKNKTVSTSNKNMKPKKIDETYTRFIEHMTKKELQDKYMNKHEYKLTLNPVDACRKPVFMAIIIHSSLQNIGERNGIRETWGSITEYKGRSIIRVFLLAESEVQNETLTVLINEESAKYGDIVQGSFIDSYRNLTYKNVMGLHWVYHFCNETKFVFKTDDDAMVDMIHLFEFIMKQSSTDDIDEFFYCHRSTGSPLRGKSKWRISMAEYPYKRYPTYCFGYAYLMSLSVTMKLYEASRWVKFFWIDDVLITGFVALKAGVTPKSCPYKHRFIKSKKEVKSWDKSVIVQLTLVKHFKKNWESINHIYQNITTN